MEQMLAQFFPIIFILGWFFVSIGLCYKSGWVSLMRRYPDRAEAPILMLRSQSGRLNGVRYGGILKLSACPSGLRVGIYRIFGIFCRNFLVPWDEISITRKRLEWGDVIFLKLGPNPDSVLAIDGDVADRIAKAVPERWHEEALTTAENLKPAASQLFKYWLRMTVAGAIFFTVAPRLFSPGRKQLPVAVTICFPAVVFGIQVLILYYRRAREQSGTPKT